MKVLGLLFIISLTIVKCSNVSDDLAASDNRFKEINPGCKYEDGPHCATVDYHNPETEFSSTYNVEVEVQDCEVTQINFPKDGWQSEDHLHTAKIDKDGFATIEDDRGRTWKIHLN